MRLTAQVNQSLWTDFLVVVDPTVARGTGHTELTAKVR